MYNNNNNKSWNNEINNIKKINRYILVFHDE